MSFVEKNTLSYVETTHRLLWNDTSFFLGPTQCPSWKQHIAQSGNDTLTSMETKQCPPWERLLAAENL